jgi:starch synthase
MYSQRYGTIPIVRATGGLEDTVEDLDETANTGTGFKFRDVSSSSMMEAVRRAVSIYREKPDLFRAMQLRGMRKRFGWQIAAKHYVEVYHWALERKGVRR